MEYQDIIIIRDPSGSILRPADDDVKKEEKKEPKKEELEDLSITE